MFRGIASLSMTLEGQCFITGDDGLGFIVVDWAVLPICDYLPIGEMVGYEAKYDHQRHQLICTSCRVLPLMDETVAEVPSASLQLLHQVAKHNKIPPRPHANAEPDAEPEP
jgi:hypothetical protein